jgi:hypothetical protein
MKSCDIVRQNKDKLRGIARESRREDKEHAISVCPDGSMKIAEGDGDSVSIDNCEDEVLNIHTHPAGNPVRASRRDIGSLLRMYPDEDVDRACVMGAGESHVRCLEVDRSQMDESTYVAFVNQIDRRIRHSEGLPWVDEMSPVISSCEVDL